MTACEEHSITAAGEALVSVVQHPCHAYPPREKQKNKAQAHAGHGPQQPAQVEACCTQYRCIDPALSAQLKLLRRMPRQGFACSAPDEGAGGCRNRSNPR